MKIGQKEKQLVTYKFYLTVESASDIYLRDAELAGQWLLSQLRVLEREKRGFIDTAKKKLDKFVEKGVHPNIYFGNSEAFESDATNYLMFIQSLTSRTQARLH